MATMTVTLVALLAMCTVALGGDVAIESIDYARLKELLPEDWIIKAVTVVDPPDGWHANSGGKGIRICFENPSKTLHHPITQRDYHPWYCLSLVPLDWEGGSIWGEQFAAGEILQAETGGPRQRYPDRFTGTFPCGYYFESRSRLEGWRDPFEDLSKYFEEMR